MAEANFTVENQTLKVIGRLNVDTVSRYFSPGLQAIDDNDSLTVDLAEAEIVGSAGVALFIAFQRKALESGKAFSIANAPEHFIEMARVSGVADILPFTDQI